MLQPNCEELELQFIKQPDVIDERATKPKQKNHLFLETSLFQKDSGFLSIEKSIQ